MGNHDHLGLELTRPGRISCMSFNTRLLAEVKGIRQWAPKIESALTIPWHCKLWNSQQNCSLELLHGNPWCKLLGFQGASGDFQEIVARVLYCALFIYLFNNRASCCGSQEKGQETITEPPPSQWQPSPHHLYPTSSRILLTGSSQGSSNALIPARTWEWLS